MLVVEAIRDELADVVRDADVVLDEELDCGLCATQVLSSDPKAKTIQVWVSMFQFLPNNSW